MLVLYYFQGELGESLERPNAFMLNSTNNQITFGTFLKAFPFGQDSSLVYRFRLDDNVFDYVWKDISDLNEIVPISKGVITVKILRTDNKAVKVRKVVLRPKVEYPDDSTLLAKLDQRGFESSGNTNYRPPAAATANTAGVSTKAKISEDTRSEKFQPSNVPPSVNNESRREPAVASAAKPPNRSPTATTPKPATAPASTSFPAKSNAPDILNFDEEEHFFSASASAKSGKSATATVPDMMDFGSSSAKPTASSSTKKTVTMDIDIDEGVDIDMNSSSLPSREELAARKNDQISEKVKGALDFKKEMDSKKEKSMQEFDEARQKHEEALQNWAYNGKVRRNVRTLLSTAQNVLPKDSKWKPISLGDLLEPAQIKKQYRKAMLIVHPDHCINADSETKFICKRVFEAINEAYDEFLQKEGL